MGGGAPRSSGPGGEANPLRGAMIFLQRKINTLPQDSPSTPQDSFFMILFFPASAGRLLKAGFFFSLKPVSRRSVRLGPV